MPEPALAPMDVYYNDRVPARTGKLRAYGNAIVPQVAAAFITAFLACDTQKKG